jgi:ABC-type transport system involved in cytochrome c biogenesis ATPase subunit
MFVFVKNVRLLKRKATDMADDDLRDQIARIEADIEQLAETLDGCRKAMALAKVAIAAGGVWILAYLLGAINFEPATMIGAIAIIIGGVVVFGSNSSTSKQTMAAMKAAETQRAKLIDMIDLRAVGTSRGGGLQHVD